MQCQYLDARGRVFTVAEDPQKRGSAPVVSTYFQSLLCIFVIKGFRPASTITASLCHDVLFPSISSILLHHPPLLCDDPAVISPFQPGHIGNVYTQIITCSQTNVAINVVSKNPRIY